MRLAYRLAERKDDPALRRLLASVAMPGAITVTFEREPDYFSAMRMAGKEWQALLAEDADTGELAGVLCRAVQDRFVNGACARTAYWGQLRVAEKYHGSVFLSRAFAFARGVYEKDPRAVNFAVIADGNKVAKQVFAEKHARIFPPMRPLCRILTFGMTLGRRWRAGSRRAGPPGEGRFEFANASEIGLSRIVAFLQETGSGKQLFPVYDENYFCECGYDATGFILAHRKGRIVGVAGLWDQSGCKQTIVRSYNGALKLARPFYNLAAPFRGHQPLPNPGEHMCSIYLSFIAVEDNAQDTFAAMLAEACRQAFARGFGYLMLGLSEGDPLAALPRALPHIAYSSTLYTVELGSGIPFHTQLDGRIPYIEIATL